jgi:hypothetical protein
MPLSCLRSAPVGQAVTQAGSRQCRHCCLRNSHFTWGSSAVLPASSLNVTSVQVWPEEMVQDSWLNVDLRWGSPAGLDQDFDICFDIRQVDGNDDRMICKALSPEWPTGRWESSEVVDVSYQLNMDPFLESGTYSVTARVVPAGQGAAGELPLEIGRVSFATLPRVFADQVDLPPGNIDVGWEDAIRLSDYQLLEEDGLLIVDLRWEATERLAGSYKVFLHLIEAESGQIVGQVDTVPRDWAYPTSWWEAGEVVTDRLNMPLDEAGPGRYQLWLGLYDAGTGERLLIEDVSGDFVESAGDRLLLREDER